MMYNRAVPPVYLAFDDAEFWRRTCINYGDYIETVITNNGDDTVNIVRRFRSVIMNSNQKTVTTKKLEVLETQNNVDNSEGTYTAGTTKQPVGITQRQCDAITNIGYWHAGDGITNIYINSTLITSANDYSKFRNLTQIYGNWTGSKFGGVKSCSNVESAEIPSSLTTIGQAAFYGCSKLTSFDFKNVKTIARAAFQGTKLTSVVLNEGFTTISGGSYGAFSNLTTVKYFDFPSTTTTIDDGAIFKYGSPVVVCRAINPPSLSQTTNNNNVVVYVPQESLEAYQTATGWSRFASKTYAIEGTYYETHRELEPTT